MDCQDSPTAVTRATMDILRTAAQVTGPPQPPAGYTEPLSNCQREVLQEIVHHQLQKVPLHVSTPLFDSTVAVKGTRIISRGRNGISDLGTFLR
jgi:hypothetical protein